MKDPFDDCKIVDGIKLYRGVCTICDAEFWHKNPYKETCGDKERHAVVNNRRKIQQALDNVPASRRLHRPDWSGSWDNIVSAYEE